MKCPKCEQTELAAQVVQDVEVDQCPSCRGIWFDEQELPRVLTLNPADLKPLTQGRSRPDLDRVAAACPVDATALIRVFSQQDRQVVLDRCPNCLGVWLDGGEFKRLVQKS